MNHYEVVLTHSTLDAGRWYTVGEERTSFYGYGDARTHLAQLVRKHRNSGNHYVVHDGGDQFYFADHHGPRAATAKIRSLSATPDRIDLIRMAAERLQMEVA